MNDYAAFLQQLYRRQPTRARLGLARMEALLGHLGNPQDTMLRIVVAGTNGKGSTSALIAAALQQAGHRVGLFTSPHLLRFTERIRVQGVEIAAHNVVQLGQKILATAAAKGIEATFFEVALALALTHFAAAGVQVAVLEVGLGGRLDATNVAGNHLAVVTPIAYDHQDLLGHTLAAIAAEKAGIIATKRPVVVSPQDPVAQAVIAARAQALAAPLHAVPPLAGPLSPGGGAAFLPPYQRVNYATAAAACALLHAEGPLTCPPEAFAAAAAAFVWPGRYQWLVTAAANDTLAASAAPNAVILDGGHNPAGAQALHAALTADPRTQRRRQHMFYAAVQGKDSSAMVAALAPRATSWRICGLQSARRQRPEALAAQVGRGARPFASFADAWADFLAASVPADDLVVVTGSLFLIGDALAHLTHQRRDPPIDG